MSDIITLLFIGIIACIIINFFSKKQYTNEGVLGSLASTLGVLGTFVGIFIGLLNFDPNNITESVPTLLSGMKIAFATSIAGMSASIIMKYVSFKKSKSEEDEDIDDIVELFNNMIKENKNTNQTLLKNQEQTKEIFLKLSESFSQNQQELKKEISNLNNSNIKKQDELILEFKEFKNEMSKNNADALIEALNNVIKDFNNKITQQFGDNFKELNTAVSSLLIWQEHYKETIELTTSELNKTFEAIKDVEKSVMQISSNSTLIKENNENLNSVLKDISNTQEGIKESMIVLANASDKAKEVIPNMETYFEDANKHILKSVDSVQKNVDKSLDAMQNYISEITLNTKNSFEENGDLFKCEVKQYIEEFEKVINQIRVCVPMVNDNLEKSQVRFNHSLNSFVTQIKNAVELNLDSVNKQVKSLEGTSNNIDNVINDSTKRLEDITVNTSSQIKIMVEEMEKVFEKKVIQLDKLLEIELTKSLNSLSGQLITISEKFADDYVPLANKLKEVVKIAEEI